MRINRILEIVLNGRGSICTRCDRLGFHAMSQVVNVAFQDLAIANIYVTGPSFLTIVHLLE